jgi:hypothetical protein
MTAFVEIGHGVAPVVREELGKAAKPRLPFWYEAGSAFRSKLADLLADVDVEFREFTWSGSNSFQARTFASEALREYLKPHLARPQTQHVPIGHSHAGNVIFEALTGADPIIDAERLAGVLSLATPYLAIETETDNFNLLLHEECIRCRRRVAIQPPSMPLPAVPRNPAGRSR